jgi:hypothetical protein
MVEVAKKVSGTGGDKSPERMQGIMPLLKFHWRCEKLLCRVAFLHAQLPYPAAEPLDISRLPLNKRRD